MLYLMATEEIIQPHAIADQRIFLSIYNAPKPSKLC